MSLFDNYKEVLIEDMDNLDEIMPCISLFNSRMSFTRMIQHYELFKHVMDIPGHIVEVGVYKGESFFNWARFVEMYNMGERQTKVIGFDTFEGFPDIHDKDKSIDNQTEDSGLAVRPSGFHPGQRAYKRIMQLIDIFENDHFVPSHKRLEIIKGDILETLPKYVDEHPGLRISLLNIDVDLYEPTLCALKHLYPRVVSGGIVILDEYAQDKFPGESIAFDEYFGGNRPKLIKSSLVSNPSGYFIKKK